MNDTCVFCKIGRHEVPATVVHETDTVIVFVDQRPKASTHLLIVPKQHLEHIGTASDQDQALLGQLLLTARDVAHLQSLEGFKLAINNGAAVGQTVPHLHLHLLSGQLEPGALQSL